MKEEKPTVVFIPGTLLSPAIFRRLRIPLGFEPFFSRWMVEPGSHDVRKVGRRIAEMIEQENMGSVILAGHSSGGSIAMLAYLACQDKARIKGMILSNTGPNNHGHSNQKTRQELIESWNRKELDLFIRKCFVKPLEEDLYEELMEYGGKVSAEVRVEPLMSQREIDLTDRLKEIKCPVIIAHGKLDTIRTLQHAEQLKREIPDAAVVLLDAGHTPMYEASEDYQKVLDEMCCRALE